ncbi:hypothetical protein V490_00275 [Pseudogymnoascus sp. VKM F-3557]|nr:hypothetical protein V490_00275 [Pseudogymnoascus sp. VKM F-3557]
MSRRGTRGLTIQETEDDASSITVSTPSFKRPRGRPRKIPLQSEQPRAAQAHVISDPAIISTSKPIITIPSSSRLRALRSAVPTDHNATDRVVNKLRTKRKRTLSGGVRPAGLRTVCEGCKRKYYPRGENREQGLTIICHKCNKEWHAECMTRKGIQRGGASNQWECCDCSRKRKPPPPRPVPTDDTEAEVMLDQQARDTTIERDPGVLSLGTNIITQELDMFRVTDYGGHLVNFSKITFIQAQHAYEEARNILNNVLSERKTCRGRFYELKTEIGRFRHELEEHRRHFDSDSVSPGDGESKHSMTQRLVLGISANRDWTDKISGKIDLIRADERRLTERVKSLRGDLKTKKAALKELKQQRSRYSTCLETSYRDVEKLQSIVSIDLEENSPEDSDSSSESTMEDSVVDLAMDTGGCEITQSANSAISLNGIAKGIERPAEEANQQHMTAQLLDGTDGLEFSQVAEDSDRLSRAPSQQPLTVPLETNAQAQPAICTMSGAIQELQNSNSAEERDRIRGLCQLSETDKECEHLVSSEEIEPSQTQPPRRSLIIPLKYTPTKELNTASNIHCIEPVVERLENADENEIQAFSQPSETVRGPAEAIQGLSVNTEEQTSLQEASFQPSDVTLDMSPSAGLVEGGKQRRDFSPATSIVQEHDQSCPPEGCCRSFNPAASCRFSEDVYLRQHLESSSISPGLEAANVSISTRDQRPEKPHIPRLALEEMARSSANLMYDKIVLPPITSFAPTHTTLQSSALPSLAPQTHILKTCISSNTVSQHATNVNLQMPVSEAGNRNPFWISGLHFRECIADLLLNGEDDTELYTPTMAIYQRDLRTLVTDVGYLSDKIINEYLKCLAHYTNGRRESDIPDSCNKIAMIGSTDPIPPGLLKSLDAFAIYVPIKLNTHWILAVLYPGSLGQRGRSEVYDSHQHWINSSMTANDVLKLLKFRLGDEFNPREWAVSAQQCSRPQRSDADSGLYVLANAKSIALNLGMMDLDSHAQSISLRWQFAQELVTQSVVEAF